MTLKYLCMLRCLLANYVAIFRKILCIHDSNILNSQVLSIIYIYNLPLFNIRYSGENQTRGVFAYLAKFPSFSFFLLISLQFMMISSCKLDMYPYVFHAKFNPFCHGNEMCYFIVLLDCVYSNKPI